MKAHCLLLTILFLFVASAAFSAEAPPAKWGEIPLIFEPNQGQMGSEIKYSSRGVGYGLFFTEHEAIVALARGDGAAVRMKLAGQNPNVSIDALDLRPSVSHYFRGSGSADWQGSVPHYGRLRYRSVYPGIDLVYYGNQRQLEYDFTVTPGADPARIQLQFTGADRVAIDEQGDLVLETSAGNLRQQRPVAFQEKDGKVQSVSVAFKLTEDQRVGFELGPYDSTLPLVIDPTLVYSSYAGGSTIGSAGDQGNAIAVDAAGNAYITGFTTSTDFLSGLARGPRGGGLDAFVMKLSADGGNLISAAYLGGSDSDEAHDIALDSNGNIYIVGYTSSPNFPLVSPIQTTDAGLQDAFIIKFNNDASAILYSTYLGGTQDDRALSVAIDSSNNVYVAGLTGSRNFPTRSPFQGQYGGGQADVFVTKLSSFGQIIYSTYIGGVGHDQAYDVAVDGGGNAIIAGFTTSINYPLLNPFVTAYRGGSDDGIVTKLSPSGSALVFSTYIGGTASDNAVRVAVDADANMYVTGYTSSADFPITVNSYQPLGLGGEYDAFLTKFAPDGQQVPFSSYIGADGTESGVGLAIDPAGNVYLAGFTSSFQFYSVNPLQRLLNNGAAVLTRDGYVMKFTPDLAQILYATYLGGAENDGIVGLAVDPRGNAYITGYSLSDNFPLANAFQPQRNGGQDAFVAKINADDIKTSAAFLLSSGGGVSFQTDAGTPSPLFGYATAEVAPGAPLPTGLAITGLQQIGQLVSEIGLPLTKNITNGRMFVELGGTSINTVLTIMNPNNEDVEVSFFYTNALGETSNFGTTTIAAKGHFSRFLTDDPYNILTDTSGTLTFDASLPVAVAGFRTLNNQAGNFILTRTPIVDPYVVTNVPTTIPIFADNLGWNTQIVLVNTTEETLTGEVQFFGPGNSGETGPIDVTTGDVINGFVTQSAYPYEIPPRASARIITSSSGESLVSGFATIVPTPGVATPAAFASVSLTEAGTTEVQTSVEAEVPQSSFRLYAETNGNYQEFEALSIRTAIAISNPSAAPVPVTLALTNLDGTPTGITASAVIPANGQLSQFLDEIPGLENIPNPFTGVLNVTAANGQRITAMSMRTRAKEFGGFLATTTGPIPDEAGSDSMVVFPHIAEGGGYTTEFILLSAPGAQGSSGVLSFVSTEGQPLNLSVR